MYSSGQQGPQPKEQDMISIKTLANGKHRVLRNGTWTGTTLKADGTFGSGPYLTAEEAAIVAELVAK